MKTKKESVISYENKNAHSECPSCDSLNTFFISDILFCKDCKKKKRIYKLDAKRIKLLLSVVVGLAIIYITLF